MMPRPKRGRLRDWRTPGPARPLPAPASASGLESRATASGLQPPGPSGGALRPDALRFLRRTPCPANGSRGGPSRVPPPNAWPTGGGGGGGRRALHGRSAAGTRAGCGLQTPPPACAQLRPACPVQDPDAAAAQRAGVERGTPP
ncbi:hypothetical protein PVAP13_3NG315332 [Panicum virgatum]|uniref:Uncharacterized protein n=1 Tax=Panicum virgatum TaxID=38727 RepID=A0A8T0UAB7_PANVG|nr:hypothetical protein PVAP13_3NG315332 [Panicum virgatum]